MVTKGISKKAGIIKKLVPSKKKDPSRIVDDDNNIIINNPIKEKKNDSNTNPIIKKAVKKSTTIKKKSKRDSVVAPIKNTVSETVMSSKNVNDLESSGEKEVKPVVKKTLGGVKRARVATGIKGFDKLVQGGFPEGFVVLVAGTPGTGKTLFGMEFLYNGASQFKEKSMLITFEQSLDDVRHQASCIGMDLVSLEKKGILNLMHIPINELDHNTLEKIKKEVTKLGVKRLVVDSISTLSINAPIYDPVKEIALKDIMNYKAFFSPPIMGDFVVNRFIYSFIDSLRRMDCTTILISEASEKGEYISRDTISEFIADGVLSITFESMGGAFARSLIVRKMRGTKNDDDIHPLEISENGLVVHESV